MKLLKIFLLSGVMLMTVTSSYAVKAIEDGSKFGTGEDSIRCLEQLSLFNGYFKIKSYDDAYTSYKIIAEECPQAGGRSLYGNAATVIKTKMSQSSDKDAKQKWFKELMDCYDKRSLYFGNDKKYPDSYIKGRQAIDYIELSGDPDMLNVVLPWLEKSVNDRGSASQADVIDYYFRMLEKQYQSDPDKYKESFINKYLKIDNILSGSIAIASEDPKNAKTAEAYRITRNNVNSTFISSGAADCKTLDSVFDTKVESSKEDVVDLTTIIKLYRSARCTESEVFFKASAYAHKLNPTSETAAGCGYQAIKKEDYGKALDYFLEAIALVEPGPEADSTKYELQYVITGLYMAQGKFSDAKSSALRAMVFNPSEGEPYIALAQIYVNPDCNPYKDDKILSKTVYWAAVDELERAKAVDPECADRAQALINQYRKYYPSKEDVFFKPELKVGETFHIGGIINESVRCRD